MKTNSHLPLLSLMWLSGGGMLWAQEPSTPAAPASTSAFATSSQPVAMAPSDRFPHTLRLSAGTLGQILAEVEDHVQAQGLQPGSAPIPENAADAMPNLLYDPDTEKLPVPASLVLRNVTPLQAVTLVAAAAGCTLEPVTAPVEEGSAKPDSKPQVVGYRVVKASRTPTATRFETFNMRLPDREHLAILRKKLETLQQTLGDKHPAIGEVRDELARMEQMKADVLKLAPPGISGSIRVVEPLPGGAPPPHDSTSSSSIFVERRTLPFPAQAGTPGSESGTMTEAPALNNSVGAAVTPPAPAGPVVRIYALAALVAGREMAEARKTQTEMEGLIISALDRAALGGKAPDLAFHNGSKVLVAKASPEQHDIIGQVLTALKENQLAESAARKP